MQAAERKVVLFQLIISIVVTGIVYWQVGAIADIVKGRVVESHETRKFLALVENPQKLKAVLEKKINQDPSDRKAWQLLAGCYHQLGENENALYAARKAQELR